MTAASLNAIAAWVTAAQHRRRHVSIDPGAKHSAPRNALALEPHPSASIPPRPWTKIYFDEEDHGNVRDGDNVRKITYEVDEAHLRLTLRVDAKSAAMFAGSYELRATIFC